MGIYANQNTVKFTGRSDDPLQVDHANCDQARSRIDDDADTGMCDGQPGGQPQVNQAASGQAREHGARVRSRSDQTLTRCDRHVGMYVGDDMNKCAGRPNDLLQVNHANGGQAWSRNGMGGSQLGGQPQVDPSPSGKAQEHTDQARRRDRAVNGRTPTHSTDRQGGRKPGGGAGSSDSDEDNDRRQNRPQGRGRGNRGSPPDPGGGNSANKNGQFRRSPTVLKPDKFSGNDSFESFIMSFNNAAKYNKWEEVDK